MATYDKATGSLGTGKLRINVTYSQNTANDTTSFSFSFQIVNGSSSTHVGSVGWSADAAGVDNSGAVGISGGQTVTLWSSSRGPFTHDSNGNLSAKVFSMHMNATGTSGLGGPTDHSATITVPRIPEAPGAPGTPSVSSIDTDSAHFTWTAAPRGHANITDYGVYVSTNSSFTSHVYAAWGGTSLSRTVSGLTAGTTYYVRTRAQSSDGVGAYSGTATFSTLPGAPASAPTFSAITPTSVTVTWPNPSGSTTSITGYDYQVSSNSSFTAVVATVATGKVNSDNTANNMTLNPGTQYWVRVRAKIGTAVGPWSSTGTFTTLPSTPPTFIIVPAASGTSVTLTLTPPSGVTGVDEYQVERRVQGTVTPVTTGVTFTNTLTMTGLTPGVTYEYRALAVIDSYTSPWSAWSAQRQPQPSTNPGDYFDGSSTATANETFRWTGTINNSTSEAVGTGVLGWETSALAGGGQAVLTRVVGGYVGDYAARMLVTVAPTTEGMRFGQTGNVTYASDVVPLTTYYGSIYVNPSRDQRLTAEITWVTDAFTLISRETNAGLLCAAGTWTRLSVNGAAPATAEYAMVRVVDVTGTGWSLWQTGESLLADAAMLTLENLFPYFDGDTEDSDEYTYAWEGTTDNSISTRSIVSVPDAPVIRDPDCPPPPTPPRPPVINSDCIDETGVWRRYWSLIPSYEVSTTLYVVPAIVVSTEGYALRQLRVRFYQAPAGEDDPNAIDPTSWVSEMVVSYVPANTVLTLDSVEQRATASVNGSALTDASHLLYGSGGAPVVWPILNCGVNYFVSFDTPVTAPVGNQTFEAVLTQRY